MKNLSAREKGRIKRHGRIRKKLSGTAERPRLTVHRSAKNIYVQVINDEEGKTLFSFSTLSKDFSKDSKDNKVNKSVNLGQQFGKVLKDKGINKVAFDRGGYLYHGRVKALADSLRESGIEF